MTYLRDHPIESTGLGGMEERVWRKLPTSGNFQKLITTNLFMMSKKKQNIQRIIYPSMMVGIGSQLVS